MSLKDCSCGRPVRMGARRIRVDRKNGVTHYVVHMDDNTPACVPGNWQTVMLKPYPKKNEDKEWHKMITRWGSQP